MASQPSGDAAAQYQALRESVGWAELRARTQIEMTGADRASFLHNFCTNDIKRLSPGTGCETFLTNVRGKILAYVHVFCQERSLVVETVPGQAAAMIAHLERYRIREDVQLLDRSTQWGQLLVAGPQAARLLADQTGRGPPAEPLGHVDADWAGVMVSIRRVELAGPDTFLLSCSASDVDAMSAKLLDAGVLACGEQVLEVCRIESGTPLYGVDVTEENLPQEVGRDEQAISFTKGCYLGQETVARIHALGHVNRKLVGLKFQGPEVPDRKAPLRSGDEVVGAVTSAAFSPRLAAPLALAYVRRPHDRAGARLSSDVGSAEVIRLPV